MIRVFGPLSGVRVGDVGCSALGENTVGINLKASLFWDEVLFPSLRASGYKCCFSPPQGHNDSHRQEAEAKEASLLGIDGCALGRPVGTKWYVPQ